MNPNADYDPEAYWSTVAEHIGDRDGPSVLAGDDEPFDRWKRQKFLDEMLTNLPVKYRSVLEVGCGPGGNLAFLTRGAPHELPSRLVGVDISADMVDLARETGCEVRKINGTVLPFGDGAFDVVFCATVLMHNTDDVVAPLIAEMCRVAKHRVVLYEEVAKHRRDRYSYVKRTPGEYTAMVEAHGFTCDHTAFLRHEVLQKLCRGPRKLLNPHGTEGSARNTTSRWIERTMIALFGWVDDSFRTKFGLAELWFVKPREVGRVCG